MYQALSSLWPGSSLRDVICSKQMVQRPIIYYKDQQHFLSICTGFLPPFKMSEIWTLSGFPNSLIQFSFLVKILTSLFHPHSHLKLESQSHQIHSLLSVLNVSGQFLASNIIFPPKLSFLSQVADDITFSQLVMIFWAFNQLPKPGFYFSSKHFINYSLPLHSSGNLAHL